MSWDHGLHIYLTQRGLYRYNALEGTHLSGRSFVNPLIRNRCLILSGDFYQEQKPGKGPVAWRINPVHAAFLD